MTSYIRRVAGVLILSLLVMASGCRFSNGQPDKYVNLRGSVFLGETGIPFSGARLLVDNTILKTYAGGSWAKLVRPGVYTINISTIFGEDSFEAVIDDPEQLNYTYDYTVQLPDGFDQDVFYELVFTDVQFPFPHKRVFRWPSEDTIRYAFNGGTPEHHAKFDHAVKEWLKGTQLVEFGRVNVVKVTDPTDANVIVSWGEETFVAKSFNLVTLDIEGAVISISVSESEDMLPYYVVAGEMLGMNKTAFPGLVMSEDAGPATTVSDMDRVYLMALYSTPEGFSFEDPIYQ